MEIISTRDLFPYILHSSFSTNCATKKVTHFLLGKWSVVARKVSELLSGKSFSFGIFPFSLSFHNWGPSDTFVVNSFLYSYFGDRRRKPYPFFSFPLGKKCGKLRCGWIRKRKAGLRGREKEIAAAVTMSNHRRGMEREGKDEERSHGIFLRSGNRPFLWIFILSAHKKYFFKWLI